MTSRQVNNSFSQNDNPVEVQDGTLSLTETPKPGIIGLNAQKNSFSCPVLPGIPVILGMSSLSSRVVRCLRSLEGEMIAQTRWYIETACSGGHYLTSHMGVRYIPEDRADAFGHCWIACQGSKRCGSYGTEFFGVGREFVIEARSYAGGRAHNSFEEDIFNQAIGRELARRYPATNCSQLCYMALVNGTLHFHGRSTLSDSSRARVYNCMDITIEGHEYRQGWRIISNQYLRLLPY